MAATRRAPSLKRHHQDRSGHGRSDTVASKDDHDGLAAGLDNIDLADDENDCPSTSQDATLYSSATKLNFDEKHLLHRIRS